jgi:hypothetical protein
MPTSSVVVANPLEEASNKQPRSSIAERHRKAVRVLERRPIRAPLCSLQCCLLGDAVCTYVDGPAPPPTEPSTQPYYLTVHTSERRHIVMKETQPGSPVHLNNPMRFQTCFTRSRSLLWRFRNTTSTIQITLRGGGSCDR